MTKETKSAQDKIQGYAQRLRDIVRPAAAVSAAPVMPTPPTLPSVKNYPDDYTLEDAAEFNNRGAAYYNQGNLTAALEQNQKALDIQERKAPDSLGLANSYGWIGAVYYSQGNLTVALEQFQKDLDIRKRKAPDTLDLANTHNNIGSIYESQGNPIAALEQYLKALEIRQRKIPDTQNEGAKFWLNILTELKNRGIEDIFIACVDGLKGFPDAINSVFPNTQVQLCIVHMVRNSLNYVPVKDKKEVATDLKTIYQSNTEEQAKQSLLEFKVKWDNKYPSIADSWNRNWAEIIPFLAYPEDIRKAIYTTNSIESVNFTLRKIIKNKQLFPNDDSIKKILYLALKNISKKWTMPIKNWKLALNQFAILFPERFPEKLNF